jgi:uncharacterized lipoprotein YmbA
MTRARSCATLAAVGVLSCLPACVSLKRSPEARFFVLRSLVEGPQSPPGRPTAGLVGVLPVLVPGYLDRPQLVTWRAPDELRIDEFLRWAEPLDRGITRTLAENLDTLLVDHRVIRSPWPSSAKVPWRVRVHLRVFGPQQDGEVRLEGRWAILADVGERPLVVRDIRLRRGPFAGGAVAMDAGVGVEAMSELLADLSREVAEGIRALPPAGS